MASDDDRAWEALRVLPLGQRVEITDATGRRWEGSIIPPSEFSGRRIVTLKLESGYNVGIAIGPGVRFSVGAALRTHSPPTAPTPASRVAAGGVTLLTTGGTIASRVDYETGGVRPVDSPSEILEFYPELGRSGPLQIVPVFDKMSEDIEPADWLVLADRVVAAFGAGARGVVIAHGTDTLGFTAAALAFLLRDLPGPVVLVGAQRSPDRPSSDGPSNLAAAVAVARDPRLAEVVVVMHAGLSDDRFAIHAGTKVRKMHSSRRDAFASRNGLPIGTVLNGEVQFTGTRNSPSTGPPTVDGPIDARAALVWSYPGLSAERLRRHAEGLRGVVLAGTGLGHVPVSALPWVRAATDAGLVVAMTTQCLAGNADPYVYATGRELLRAGAVYLHDLLPETAYAKLVWALGHAAEREDVVRLLLTDRAGEFSARHPPDGGA